MRDYQKETDSRVSFLRDVLKKSGATGFVFGNSGGKDSALVGVLCKMATEKTLGLVLPCMGTSNKDCADALAVASLFQMESRVIDLTETNAEFIAAISQEANLTEASLINIAPRLRMAALYAVAASGNRLVVGTDNRSEIYTGYFTKWGDGAYDVNPIADLTVTEVYEFLTFLGAPEFLFHKAPSAGLFEGQTDEMEMGVTYRAIDAYITSGYADDADRLIIERHHDRSEHKRRMPLLYSNTAP